jgi:predicted RNA binding protein YcfA (HicA-like mRNA interferase family)
MGIAGVPHLRAVRALEKAGFRVAREGRHIVMTDGEHVVTIPRHDPVNANTMGVIVRGAGLTPTEFRRLLYTSAHN